MKSKIRPIWALSLVLALPLFAAESRAFTAEDVAGLEETFARDNLWAPEGEESETIVFAIENPEDADEALPSEGPGKRKKKKATPPSEELRNLTGNRPVVGTVVKVVPLEPKKSPTALNVYAGISNAQFAAGGGLALKVRPWLVGDINLGFQTIGMQEIARNPNGEIATDSQFASQFSTSLRIALLRDRVQFGVAYQSLGSSKLDPAYRKAHSGLGYAVRVNLIQFSDKESTGNRLYLVVSGIRKGLAPTMLGAAYTWNLGN